MTLFMAIKSLVVLSLAWLIVSGLPRLSPAAKHAVWLAGMAILLVLPELDGLLAQHRRQSLLLQ